MTLSCEKLKRLNIETFLLVMMVVVVKQTILAFWNPVYGLVISCGVVLFLSFLFFFNFIEVQLTKIYLFKVYNLMA